MLVLLFVIVNSGNCIGRCQMMFLLTYCLDSTFLIIRCLSHQVFKCANELCEYFYHPNCVAQLLHPNDQNAALELQQTITAGDGFTCPLHKCSVCDELENPHVPDLNLAVCRRCPTAYHRSCLLGYLYNIFLISWPLSFGYITLIRLFKQADSSWWSAGVESPIALQSYTDVLLVSILAYLISAVFLHFFCLLLLLALNGIVFLFQKSWNGSSTWHASKRSYNISLKMEILCWVFLAVIAGV